MYDEDEDEIDDISTKILKIIHWPLELVCVLFVGWLFAAIYHQFDSYHYYIPYFIYLACVVWVASLRILRAIKKSKESPENPPR